MSNFNKCEYCDSLITKYTMKRHHQTKKCLVKQDILKKFKCVCNEKFILQDQLNEHTSICLHVKLEIIEKKHVEEIEELKQTHVNKFKEKEIEIEDLKQTYANKLKKKEKEIEELKQTCENRLKEKDNEIVSLEKKILQTKLEGKEECLSIAKTAKGTTNNNTNNIKNMIVFNLSERINPALLNYTKEHLLQGAKGTAKWINENIITDENGNKLYICSDRSREIFKFMNEKGEVVTDVKAEFLLGSINPKLIPIASEIKTKRVK